MTIRTKIVGGFLVVFAVGLMLGIIGLVSNFMLTSMSEDLVVLQKSSSEVSGVLNAHYLWRQGLTQSVLTGGEFTGSLDPNTCALGKWKSSGATQGINDSEIKSLLEKLESPHSYIHNEAKNVVNMMDSGDFEKAKNDLVQNVLPQTEEAITILSSMEERYNTLVEQKNSDITKLGNQIVMIIALLILVAVISCLFLVWKITKMIMNPIRAITKAAEAIAIGDLDVNVHYNINDEIGSLVKSFQNIIDGVNEQLIVVKALSEGDLTSDISQRSEKDEMNLALKKVVNNLNQMFEEINTASGQVAIGSSQIAQGSQALAQGSTQQASAVEQLSASISDVADKTKKNAEMASRASHLADTIKDSAEKGNHQMEAMMEAVKEISHASQNINKVIKVIDDIAFQTNILALNAAVEAARAGQHGKGFAVVAEEVRNLASKSAEAAKETGDLIINSMEKAELGVRIATETAESLGEIVTGINESTLIVGEIAKSSEEQSSSITQINKGINQVAQVVQQNSATAEESAASSEEMSGQSSMLEGLIAQFKLKGLNKYDSFSARDNRKKISDRSKESIIALSDNIGDYGKY